MFKLKKLTVILLTLLLVVFLFGCNNTKTASKCVKCGRASTSTLCGPAEQMRRNGVDLSDCTLVTSGVYSAPICSDCLGPVAENPLMSD